TLNQPLNPNAEVRRSSSCSSSSFVLENPDISPSNRRKEIVAGKSGSFPGAEAHRIEDEPNDEDDSPIPGFRLKTRFSNLVFRLLLISSGDHKSGAERVSRPSNLHLSARRCSHAALLPLYLAGLRCGLARILEKRNSLQMSQVFPFPYIGNQMGLAFQGFYERDRRTGKVVGFPHLVHACTN